MSEWHAHESFGGGGLDVLKMYTGKKGIGWALLSITGWARSGIETYSARVKKLPKSAAVSISAEGRVEVTESSVC